MKEKKYYFNSHSITLVTSYPLSEIISNRDATSRIAKWEMDLMPYGIAYVPQTQSSHMLWLTSSWNGPKPSDLQLQLTWSIDAKGCRCWHCAIVRQQGKDVVRITTLFGGCHQQYHQYEAPLNGLRSTI